MSSAAPPQNESAQGGSNSVELRISKHGPLDLFAWLFKAASQRVSLAVDTLEEPLLASETLASGYSSISSFSTPERDTKQAETFLSRITRPRVSGLSWVVSVLLVLCSCITSTTFGYDGSMMNGLNILPGYIEYFHLNTATMSLATAALWIGGTIAGLTYGRVTDLLGRRYALFWAAVMTLASVVVQTAAQNTAMFVIGRILVGYGTSASTLTGPTYLAETLPYQWRAWGLGVLNVCYYVGGFIAAGVTYRTASYSGGHSTWCWRVPSAVQGIFSILCISILPFIPESPRWLVYVDRNEEALQVIAETYADGDATNPIVLAAFKEIVDTIDYEKNVGETLNLAQMVKTPVARKRMTLAISCAVFSTISGNVIASYYLGSMLTHAGITNPTAQLQINIILNAWCLYCALVGTYYLDHIGRRWTAIISTALLTIFLFTIGALTKIYGTSTSTPGIYATVLAIFLFQGSYSFGWTPLLYLYPPEVLNFPIRANGMGVFTFVLNATALICIFCFLFILEGIGWRTYLMNGGWDVLEVGFIWWFWVETKGKTLEEIDGVLEGGKHSRAPDLDDVGDSLGEDVALLEDGMGENGEAVL